MIINFITPKLSRRKFSGGIYCILKHADELAKMGHTVNVIPLYGGKKPGWIQCSATFLINRKPECRQKKRYKCLTSSISRLSFGLKSDDLKSAIQLDHMNGSIPDGDITIATHWSTVESAYKYGSGKIAHFMQHFEPLMFTDKTSYDYFKCLSTYLLPIEKIANSSWAQNRVSSFLQEISKPSKVLLANNGIDLEKFRKLNLPLERRHDKHIKVISYSGRGVDWKGFEEMASAVKITRNALPDWEIEWLVYGEDPAKSGSYDTQYINLGFLQTNELVIEYNKCDILLSASWYESFPLFPIESMACGLATITTQPGTEDYGFHEKTVEIVEAKNPESISRGLIKLITNEDYRKMIAEQGYHEAQKFSWNTIGKRMESTLEDIISS